MQNLKRCPLCGGEAKFLSAKFAPIGILHGIECDDCGLWLDCRERSKENAAKQWNSRIRNEGASIDVDFVLLPDGTTHRDYILVYRTDWPAPIPSRVQTRNRFQGSEE